MNPVTSWAATAPHDISEGHRLFDGACQNFTYHITAGNTTLWLVIQWPNKGEIAFRLAFTLGAVLERTSNIDREDGILQFNVECQLGDYEVRVDFPSDEESLFHFTTVFTPKEPMFIPFSPHDVVPLPKSGKVGDAKGEILVSQAGTRSGHLLFTCSNPVNGSVFYFQNLSALSDYAEATETSMGSTVGGRWPEMGFRLPAAITKPLPAGKAVTVSDAYIICSETLIDNEIEAAKAYLDHLATVYLQMPKPKTSYNDWPEIARLGLGHLKENKGCWTQAEGKSYLNAYVCDYDTPPEVMVQLAVLVPLTEYFEWQGDDDRILQELHEGLEAFYDGKVGTVCRWLPSLRHRLDQSEEQKKEYVMDSWYLHHPLMNLSRLAQRGDRISRKLLEDSLGFTMKVARHFKYEWPVFYNMETLDVIKTETAPGKGGEKDVPGAYAHLMLQARDLTDDDAYFKEAQKAVRKLEGDGFDIFYQANNTTFTAATLLRMYKETGDEKHMDLAYVCLACLFRNMQIWDGRYGYGKHYSRFFAIYPLAEAPYIAPYEELEVYAGLTYFLRTSVDLELRPSVKLLIAEFVRYFVFRMPFYYPANLPKEAISEEVKTGEIDVSLWIPLEDLRDGWEKSGQVGQEVYGAAGAGFGILPRQYFKCGDSGLLLYSDYPILRFRTRQNTATFELGGDSRLQCNIRIIGRGSSKAELSMRPKGETQRPSSTEKDGKTYTVNGGGKWKITW